MNNQKRFPSDESKEQHHSIGIKGFKRYTIKQVYDMLEAWAYCDEKDKSTEFMLQYMSDSSGVEYDDVVDYITSGRGGKDRDKYYAGLQQHLNN